MYGTKLRCVARSGGCNSNKNIYRATHLAARSRRAAAGGRSGIRVLSAAAFPLINDHRHHPHPHRKQTRNLNHAAPKTKSYPPPAPKSIAILGGGLTGLTTAHYITRYLPNAKITIYEASGRLGGWIDTERVVVKTPDGTEGQVHFERGARMVKAPPKRATKDLDGLLFCDLVDELKLGHQVRTASRGTYVGRYIYYPDHLVEMSVRPLSHLLTHPFEFLSHAAWWIQRLKDEPVFKDLFSSMISFFKTRELPLNRTQGADVETGDADMSVGEYLEWRCGSRSLVDNLMSAMMHGIYGGDVWKLSVHSSPLRWIAQKHGHEHMAKMKRLATMEDVEMCPKSDLELIRHLTADRRRAMLLWASGRDFAEGVTSKDPEWMWFRNGFGTLTDALAAQLRRNPNVTIKLNEPVNSLRYHATDTVALTTVRDKTTVLYDKVISTIFAGDLSPIVTPRLIPTLCESKAVTIQLVNLWYPTPRLNHPASGFGYLIPQSLPYEQNPEGALGVLFDSDREAGFDFDGPPPGTSGRNDHTSDTVPGTKFTVMLGGHLWDGLPPKQWPSQQEAIDMAKSVLARHLGIPKEESDRAVGSTKMCRQCIPQHFVGHGKRMKKLEEELQQAFRSRLAVIGGSYQLPGVLPSIRAAWGMARQVAREYVPGLADRLSEEQKICIVVGPTGVEGTSKAIGWLSYEEQAMEEVADTIRKNIKGTAG